MTTQDEDMNTNIKKETQDMLLEQHLNKTDVEIKDEFVTGEQQAHREFVFVKCEPVSSDGEDQGQISEKGSGSNINADIKRYNCEICKKLFKRKDYLVVHMKSHSDVKEFKCRICDKEFLEKRYLKRHTQIHFGFNELQCTVCNKQFTYNSNLVVHMKTHSDVKEFKCMICNKEFSRKARLNKHTKLHSGDIKYKCTFCDKEFADKRNFTRHKNTHTGVNKFTCSICNKQITYKGNLLSHMKTHIKDPQCSICHKQFAHNWALRAHMKLHKTAQESGRLSKLLINKEQITSQEENIVKVEVEDPSLEEQLPGCDIEIKDEFAGSENSADQDYVFVKCEVESSDDNDGEF